ncbi:MAG: LytR/AlgR family response regulator transcription factor [Sphingopyxis sp.]
MTALRLLVVDDEPLALRRLELLIARIDGAECCGSASGCREAVAATVRLRPDVVLLDVRMRDGTGFDYLDALGGKDMPQIIFVTAFDSHAVEAFTQQALDYLLKPIEQGRLEAALARARRAIAQREKALRAEELEEVVGNLRDKIAGDAAPRFETELWVRKNVTGFVRIEVGSIDWMAAEDDYVRIALGDKSYLLRSTLSELERRLDPSQFLRIHRSTIVRRAAVAEFRRDGTGFEACLCSGVRHRVGRVYAKRIRHDLARLER